MLPKDPRPHTATDHGLAAMIGRVAATVAVGYLAGTLPSSRIATELAGRDDIDPTHDGTGNPGAMNTSHLLGKKWGAAVSVADMGKAMMAAKIGRRLAGVAGAHIGATAAVVGHCHPPSRKGGKGIATSIGQVVATFPVYLPIDVAVGVATASIPWFHQRTRTAAGVASVTWVGCATLWWRRRLPNPGGVPVGIGLPVAAAISSLVIAERFRSEAASVEEFNEAVSATAEEQSQ